MGVGVGGGVAVAAGTGVSVGVGGRVAVGNDVDTSFATGVATGGAVAVGTRVGIVTGGKVAARVAVGSGAGTGVVVRISAVVQACSKMVRAPADRPKAAAVRRKSRLLICVIGWLPVFFSLAGFILTNAGPPHSFLDSLPE